MSYELLHFRNANQIIKDKKMGKEVKGVMDYLNDCLYGTQYKSELLRQALSEMEWRNNVDLNILEGRRYSYKGFKNRVAMDGSFSSYEYVQDALLRLQVGFDKGKLDMGIVLVTAQRSEKSRLGTTKELVTREIEMLHPTISLPVTIVLFDLGKPGEIYQEEFQKVEKAQPEEELPKNPIVDPEELTDHHAIHQDLSDIYLHGNQSINHENHDDRNQVHSVSEVKVIPISSKKKKPNSRVVKEFISEQRAAA